MVNAIPKKKRQISVYITRGGKMKYHEALADFDKPDDPDWENLLNSQTARDKERAAFEANLMASQLYNSKERMPPRFQNFDVTVDAVPLQEILGSAIDLDDVVDIDGDEEDVNGDGEEVYEAGEELNGHVKDINRVGEEVNGSGLSQGTFADLSDIVSDLHMGEETTFKLSSEKVAEKRGRRVKHCVRRPWPPGFQDGLAMELEEIRQKERDEADRRERKELDDLARVENELRESQAENGLSREEFETNYTDSNYELEHDDFDDAEFDENVANPDVVLEFEEMGYGGYCSDEVFNSNGLESLAGSETKEDEERNPIKMPTRLGKMKLYPYIRYVEIKNPSFRLGLLFPNVEQLREAVRECAIRNQIDMCFEKNTKKKMQVKCQWGCLFYMYANNVKNLGPDNMVVKTLNPQNICSPMVTSHFLTYRRVAKKVKDILLVDEDWSRKGIHKHIEDTYNMDIHMETITRG
ncbi:hypothetical protein ACLB2K_063603 [Fragaria x ananassa]